MILKKYDDIFTGNITVHIKCKNRINYKNKLNGSSNVMIQINLKDVKKQGNVVFKKSNDCYLYKQKYKFTCI